MKFIIFNLMVAAALVFLFTSEKGDMANVASKAEKGIFHLKKEVKNIVNGETLAQPVKRMEKKNSVSQLEKPMISVAAASASKADLETSDQSLQQKKVKALPSPKPEFASVEKAHPLDKNVSKRRSRVLGEETEITTSDKEPSFMRPTTRKRELLILAEEMEIIAAKLASE